jgi:hypothetical protein
LSGDPISGAERSYLTMDLTGPTVPVPEPSTLALAALSTALLALRLTLPCRRSNAIRPGGMPPKECGELFASIRFGSRLSCQDRFRVVTLVETVSPSLSSVEAEFHLNVFEFAKIGVDGNGGELHDRSPRLRACGFEVNEN